VDTEVVLQEHEADDPDWGYEADPPHGQMVQTSTSRHRALDLEFFFTEVKVMVPKDGKKETAEITMRRCNECL
jgi:hypothetical protein